MNLNRVKYLAIFGFAILLGIQSCSDEAKDPAPDSTDPVKTEPGIANGEATSKSIGAAGGQITSVDGKLTITIPAGALTTTTNISVQPISNLSPLGLGSAYRLGPEGTTFSNPVTLTFNYDKGTLGNTIEDFLWITTQASDGSWNAMLRSEVDTNTKKVSVKTTHFSDWSLGKFIDLSIQPFSLSLPVKKQVALLIIGFAREMETGEDDLAPLIPIVNDGSDVLAPLTPIPPIESRLVNFRVKKWTMNGTAAPVKNNFGSLTANGTAAIYEAPSKKPSPNLIAVSAELETSNGEGKKSSFLVVSNITIIDGDYYVKVNVKGTDYVYYQYGFNGQVPDGDEYDLANCGRNDDGSIGIIASHFNASSDVSNAFMANFDASSLGGRSFKCRYDEDTKDAMTFTSTIGGLSLVHTYSERTKTNDTCESESKCASISFTFTQYPTSANSEIAGSFTGVLYEDSPADSDNCKTPENYPVSGDFKLYVVN